MMLVADTAIEDSPPGTDFCPRAAAAALSKLVAAL